MVNFNRPTPHLFAHRGGNAAGAKTENTMLAFKSAVNLGYNFLETDVIVTKDREVITYHGSANLLMKKIFGLEVRRNVQKLSYNQVKRHIKPGGQNVPKFRDVLKEFKKQCFSVDVKTNEVVEPLVDLLRETKTEDRVIITSFSKKRSIRANRLLYGEDFDRACLCVYRIKGRLISIFPSIILSRLKKQGFSYLQIPYGCITNRLLKEAKRQEVKIYAWTVNDKDKIRKFLSMKIDGLISDEVEILQKSAHKI